MAKRQQSKLQTDSLAKGRGLAIEMIEELIKHGDSDSCSIEQRWHPGRPQNNLTLPYLLRLCKQPELVEGFSAVLTDCMTLNEGPGPGIEVSFYQNIEAKIRRTSGGKEGVAHG